jgi:hypothetical protein
MPITIDRTPFNALIDDSGNNLDGSEWDKDAIDTVLLDPIDAALAKAAGLALPNVFTANQRITKVRPYLELQTPGSVDVARVGQNSGGGARVDLSANLSSDGTNVNADDVTKPSSQYTQIGGIHQFLTAPAGANPRTSALLNPLTLDATGVVQLPLGQLKFPVTQNPSSDPNTFDDYEEGTWTPVVQFGGASVGIIYSEQKGYYVKVGGWVWCGIRVIITNKGTSVGSCTIAGLPFSDRDGGNFGGNCNFFSNFATVVNNMPAFYTNGAALTMVVGAAQGIIILDNTSFSPGTFIGSVMFRTVF